MNIKTSVNDLIYLLSGFIAGTLITKASPDVGMSITGVLVLGILLYVYFKYYRPYRRANRSTGSRQVGRKKND